MPPRYVKAYVKTQKNDAADAEAICEAVTRPTMRFVELKTSEQQSILVLHRTRQLFVRQRTTLINAIRAHLAEFGIVAPIGRNGVEKLLQTIGDGQDARISDVARTCRRGDLFEKCRKLMDGWASYRRKSSAKSNIVQTTRADTWHIAPKVNPGESR